MNKIISYLSKSYDFLKRQDKDWKVTFIVYYYTPRILYMTIPLFWAANIVLVLAPNVLFLIVTGILQGFYFVGSPISGAMERELVPNRFMGRWLGISRFFKMTVSACFAVIVEILWDTAGPQYVFLGFVVIDLLFRMPLLISMPETLHLQFSGKID